MTWSHRPKDKLMSRSIGFFDNALGVSLFSFCHRPIRKKDSSMSSTTITVSLSNDDVKQAVKEWLVKKFGEGGA